ncbi:hypothetical protein CSUI_010572 [Cystoisospora suis]|uniref:Uncharacterized protein n=1 Tax=Cystoisospora suis TaxID=483139 RepID=A0A2C6KG12_9APIC|nr:hypothetical protein CSUI_010572 [Cystoisospora suis]
MIYQKEHATCTKEKDMMRARREERRNIVRTPGGEEGVWIHLKDDNAFPATAASASPSSSVKSVGTCVSSPRELSSSSTTSSSSKHRHLIESSLLKATPDPVSSSKIPHYTRHASFVKSSSSSFLSSSSACVPQSQPSTIRIVKTSSPSPSSSQERSSIAEGIRGGGEIARRRQHQPLSFSCKSQAGGVELSSMKLLPASEIPRKRSVLCASSPSSSSCLSSPSRGYPSSLIPLPSSSHAMNDAISPSSSMHVFPATGQSPLISVKTSSLRNESSPRSVSSSSLSAPASLLPSLSSSSSLRLHRSAPGGGVDGEPSSVYHDCRSPLDRTSRRQSRSREGFFRQQPHHRCHHEERSSVLSGQPRGPSVSRGEREKEEEEEEKENERGKKRKLDSSIPRPGLHGGEDDTKTHEAYQREVPENLPYSIATREERSVPHPLDREDSQASIRSCIPPSEKKEEEMSATSKSVSHPKTLAWNVKKRDREEKRSSPHGNRNANHPISGCFRDISRAKSPYSAGEQTFPPVSPPRLDKNDRGGGEEEDLLQSSSSPSFLSLPVSSSSMCSTTSDYGLTLPPSPELGGGEEEEADHEGREGRCDLLGDLSPPLIPTDFFYHEQEQQRDVSSPRETIETHRSSRQSVEQPTQGKKETFPTRDRLSCSPTQEPPSKKSEDDPSKMSSSVRRLERHSPLRSEETCCQVKRNGREEENRQFFLLHKKDGGERSVHHKDLKRDGDEKIKAKTKEQSSLLLHHSSSSHVNQEMTSSYHHLHHTSSSSSCCHTNSSTSSSSIPSPTLFIVSAKKRLRHQQSK